MKGFLLISIILYLCNNFAPPFVVNLYFTIVDVELELLSKF